MSKQIRISFSPYTYARVAAMKGSLFSTEDYKRILKMGYNELLRLLQDSSYKQEIDSFKVDSEGLATIEHALNANLMRTFEKLHRISLEGMKEALSAYLLRYDMENIKLIVRSKRAKIDADSIRPLLYNSLNYSKEFWETLLAKKTVEEVITELGFLKWIVTFEDYFMLENALDRYYVEKMLELAKNVGGEGRILMKFLREEVELMNIRSILRVLPQDENVYDFLIEPTPFVLELATKKTLKDMITVLRKHKRLTNKNTEELSAEQLEVDLETQLLRREVTLMHKNPLSASYLLGFMFAKEVEVRNLKMLAKGKKLEIEDEILHSMLVMGA